jgi:glycosyltransferase involved in cell wall biosynthesis
MFHIVGSETSGDKAWAQELRKVVQELQLEKSVKFWGFASDQIARDILQASDLFLLPTKMEGFGLVVAEALACGVPALVSAIRPLDEIVSDGESGFLLPSDAPELFAARAIDILGNHGLHGRLAESGRKRVLNNFSEQVFCRKVTDSYEEIRRDMVVRMPVR